MRRNDTGRRHAASAEVRAVSEVHLPTLDHGRRDAAYECGKTCIVHRCHMAQKLLHQKHTRVRGTSASSVMNALERRAVKRGRIVEIVKGTGEYHGASQQVKDACPDPSDHSITKRQWERVFRAWRADLKASIMLVDSPSGDAPSTREADEHQDSEAV